MSQTPPETVVSVNDLKKTFRIGFLRKRVDAVRGASFSVQRGEIFGLVGPNGAGKTTTIKMLMGLITPDSGSASIFGVPVSDVRARLKVGFLPETPNFYDYLKPGELLSYYGELYGLDRRTVKKRVPELLDLVGLSAAVDKPIRKFSKGMTQRIGLAQALLPDSELVLLDEPQSGLDPIGRKDVRDIIVSLRDRGKTVVFSSHILNDVEQICDRVAIIVAGRTTRSGRVTDMLDSTTRWIEITLVPSSDTALEALAEVAGNRERLPDGLWRFKVNDDATSTALLRAALDHHCTVTDLERHRVRLEDVFMSETRAAGGTP